MTDPERPSQRPIHPIRVALKTLLLFLVINLIYATLDPSLGGFVVLHHNDYERFPALWIPEANEDGSTSIQREIFSNLDVLFASHVVTRRKTQDEYRVFLFGDSSVWGVSIYPDQTLAGQINELHLRTCLDQPVVAYNLGYFGESVTKDLLIMQQAQQYEPDLTIWLFSINAFVDYFQDAPFIGENLPGVTELVSRYGLPYDIDRFPPPRDSFWDATIVGKRRDLNLLVRYQASTIFLDVLGFDDPRILHGSFHVQDEPRQTDDFNEIVPPADLYDLMMFESLPVAYAITAGKLIYVNEPIQISAGEDNPKVYNSAYPRWAYDQFRAVLGGISAEHGWTYLDLWDVVPEDLFSNTVIHMTPGGETILADRIAPAILGAACP